MPGDTTQGDTPLSIILTNTNPDNGGNGPRPIEFESDDFVEPVKLRLGEHFRRQVEQNTHTPLREEDSFLAEAAGDGLGQRAVRAFNNLSDSSLLPGIRVNKTMDPDPNRVTRAELYEDINLFSGGAKLPMALEQVLEENNQFSAGKPYVALEDPNENNSGTKQFYPQQTFGSHNPRKWPDALGETKPVTLKNLKDLGTQMLLEASGEVVNSRNSSKIGDTPEAWVGAAITPGAARIGARVAYSRFSPGNIIGNINPDYSPPKVSALEGDTERMSYGSPYNPIVPFVGKGPLVPFTGIGTESSQVASGLLLLTVTMMLTTLAKSIKNANGIQLNPTEGNTEPQGGNPTSNRLGSYLGDARGYMGRTGTRVSHRPSENWFLLHKTSHDYDDAVRKGIEIFFDLPNGIAGISGAVQESPGFYVTLLRSLVRDTSDALVGGIASFVAPESNVRGTLEPGVSQMNTFTDFNSQIVSLVDGIKNSRLLRFMDVVARIGDLALSQEEDGLAVGQSIQDAFADAVDDTDYSQTFGSNLNMASLVLRNKTSDRINGRLKNVSTIASNTVLSMYQLPGEYTQAEMDYFGETPITNRLLGQKLYFHQLDSTKRISAEMVDKYEDEMEAYYVPFYLHDIRTNEMVGMHIFLDSISDGFTADYADTEGLGRIGSIQTYKNTKRSINLSFYMIATNPDDMGEMWYKVNRLVTMLYPQYTEGRTISNPETGHKFVQPFSQLIGASPLVRLRVGDLIKSNFSELDLARLFGAGTKNFQINANGLKRNLNTETSIQEKVQFITDQQNSGIFVANDAVFFRGTFNGDVVSSEIAARIVVVQQPQSTTLTTSQQRRAANQAAQNARRQASADRRAGVTRRSFQLTDGNRLVVLGTVDGSNGDSGSGTYTYRMRLATGVAGTVASDEFLFTVTSQNVHTLFRLDNDEILRRARREATSENPESDALAGQSALKDVKNFFSPVGTDGNGDGGNPIVQGFNSTKGKGLAGFIKSMKMDFTESTWETEDENSKAPMRLKIDMEFAPIHDINPGLGADGFMTGAPYNIGNIMSMLKKQRGESRRQQIAVTRRSDVKGSWRGGNDNQGDGELS